MALVNHSPAATPTDIRPAHALVRWLPRGFQPFALISRWDRPIGCWLMLFPALWGLTLAAPAYPAFFYIALFAVGGWVMRGAGCTINDILDRRLDAQVARTAGRPLASGQVTVRTAWLWLALQLLVGLILLLQLPPAAQLAGVIALPLILVYPLMKRITWWPQAWLGIAFNWGFWVGICIYATPLHPAFYLFYSGALFWTLGFDTIYAVQDRDDDALVGVRSTARLFGLYAPLFVYSCYLLALTCWFWGGVLYGLSLPYFLGWIMAVGAAVWLLAQWRSSDALSCRQAFVRNQWIGLILWLAILAAK